jgi:transposase
MEKITRVGVDLAKQQIQVHAVDAAERVVVAKSLRRDKFAAWCAQLPAGCIVAMEACSSAHHWARKLLAMGLVPRLIAAHFVTPYRMEGKGGKNDAADAAAICEAASRPKMRFVPVKTCTQQGILSVHRLREGYKEERNACINRIRGLLAEFGLVFAQGPNALREHLASVLEDAGNDLTTVARLALDRAFAHWRALEAEMAWCDARIAQHVKEDPQARQAQSVTGIGPTGASALVASVGDFKQFKNAAQFGAWLGLVPRQNSSGGKTSLGRITKRGDDYLRTLLIQGARSAVAAAAKKSDPISRWIVALQARVGWQKTLVAVANKNARILWAMLTKGQTFDPHYVSARRRRSAHKSPPAPGNRIPGSSSNDDAREDASHRSDRQQVSSTNWSWRLWRPRRTNGVLLSGLYLGPHRVVQQGRL